MESAKLVAGRSIVTGERIFPAVLSARPSKDAGISPSAALIEMDYSLREFNPAVLS